MASENDERLEEAQDYYWHAETELERAGNEYKELIEEAMSAVSMVPEVKPKNGAIEYEPDFAAAVEYLNDRLEWPTHAAATRKGIRIKRLNTDIEDEEADTTKDIVRLLQQNHENGAPIQSVIAFAEKTDIPAQEVQHDIQKLKDRGDIYEPTTDHLRVV